MMHQSTKNHVVRSTVSTDCDIELTLVGPDIVEVDWRLEMPFMNDLDGAPQAAKPTAKLREMKKIIHK